MKLLLLSATAVALAIGGLAARPAAAAGPVVAADGTRTVSFDVFLPLRDAAGLDRLLEAQQDPHSALYRHWLTPAEFKARFGAEPGALARVSATLRAAGFFVTEHASSLRATGHVADAEALFGTKLGLVARPAGGRRLAASATFRLPRTLVEAGASVFAFDAHLPERHVHSARAALPENRYSPDGGYWYNDLKQAYHYPSYATQLGGKTLNGQGSNIGILMSSDVLDSDIKSYFDHENFATTTGTPDPAVYQRRPVFGGAAFDPNSGGSFEATLDVEQALGGAPGANLYLYNIPDLTDGSISAAIVDVDEDNQVDLLSMSFGGCERTYAPGYNGGQSYWGVLDSLHQLFVQGNAQGITFIASSGDSGGLGCPNAAYLTDGTGITNGTGPYKFVAGVENPASDPAVTGVGGTNLITTTPPSPQTTPPTLTSAYVGENAEGDPEIAYNVYGFTPTTNNQFLVSGGYWGAGGGVSTHFAKPGYQYLVPTGAGMRTVPDLGMQVGGCPDGLTLNTCPPTSGQHLDRSLAEEWFAGSQTGVIGTSVAAPEFAGAVALAIQVEGKRLGNINPMIYRMAARQNAGIAVFFRRQIPGFDGLYKSHRGDQYNYITGNGTPKIKALLKLPDAAAAGDPQTAGNP